MAKGRKKDREIKTDNIKLTRSQNNMQIQILRLFYMYFLLADIYDFLLMIDYSYCSIIVIATKRDNIITE